jgi:MOSC domain-containing protein YiiM
VRTRLNIGTDAILEITGLHEPCVQITRFRPGDAIQTKRPQGLYLLLQPVGTGKVRPPSPTFAASLV